MITVNSLSGGKTSSYLAVHYPADYELFALMCNDDPRCAHPDPKIMQSANDKLSKYSDEEFIGTPEHWRTLEIVLNLEQKIGREIIWLRGKSFDWWIQYKKQVPNQNQRWCTTGMKLDPIFNFCYLYTELPVSMRVGFRHDEQERAGRFTNEYSFPKNSNNYGQHRRNWETIEWRVGEFPLIEDKITNYQVNQYWKDYPEFIFPKDTNCQMCFWKNEQQLRKNFEDSPHVMNWAKDKEKQVGGRFRHKMNMEQIQRLGLQQDFIFGTGVGCQEGFCTD